MGTETGFWTGLGMGLASDVTALLNNGRRDKIMGSIKGAIPLGSVGSTCGIIV